MAFSTLPYKLGALVGFLSLLYGFFALWSPGQTAQWDVTGLDQREGPVQLDQGAVYHLDLAICLPKGATFTINGTVVAVGSGRVETADTHSFAYARAGKSGCLSMRGVSYFVAVEGGAHMVSWNASANLVALRPVMVLKREWLSPWNAFWLMMGGIAAIAATLAAWSRREALDHLPKEVGLKRFGPSAEAKVHQASAARSGMAVARSVTAAVGAGPPSSVEPLWTYTDVRAFKEVRFAADGARVIALVEPVAFGPGAPAMMAFSLAGAKSGELFRRNVEPSSQSKRAPQHLAVGAEKGVAVVRWGSEAFAVENMRELRWSYAPPSQSSVWIVSIATSADGHLTVISTDRLEGLGGAGEKLWETAKDDDGSPVAMPDDGRFVAVAKQARKRLEILSPDGKQLHAVESSLEVRSVAVSRDGTHVLAQLGDAWLAMFSEDGDELWRASTHSRPRVVAMPADGSFVVVLNSSGQILILDAEGKEVSCDEGAGDVADADISPDGTLLMLAKGHELMAVRLQR